MKLPNIKGDKCEGMSYEDDYCGNANDERAYETKINRV